MVTKTAKRMFQNTNRIPGLGKKLNDIFGTTSRIKRTG
jgi:hypothetical protein